MMHTSYLSLSPFSTIALRRTADEAETRRQESAQDRRRSLREKLSTRAVDAAPSRRRDEVAPHTGR